MRYIAATAVSVVLTAVLFVLAKWVVSWVNPDEDFGVALPPIAIVAISLAYFICRYWYAIALLFLVTSLVVAAPWPEMGGS
jgi:hypothetical protein